MTSIFRDPSGHFYLRQPLFWCKSEFYSEQKTTIKKICKLAIATILYLPAILCNSIQNLRTRYIIKRYSLKSAYLEALTYERLAEEKYILKITKKRCIKELREGNTETLQNTINLFKYIEKLINGKLDGFTAHYSKLRDIYEDDNEKNLSKILKETQKNNKRIASLISTLYQNININEEISSVRAK